MFDLPTILLLLGLGCLIGTVAGMFGIGGGAILVPILTGIFISYDMSNELAIRTALGTSMSTIIITSFSSAKTHHKAGYVMWKYFWLIAVGVIFGTFIGSSIAVRVNHVYLAIFFSFIMFYSATRMFFAKNEVRQGAKALSDFMQSVAGVLIGIISSLVSIGGGMLTVPFLAWQGFDIKKAIGTSSAVGFPIAVGGSIGYMLNGWELTDLSEFRVGYVNLLVVVIVCTMSYIFAPFGARLTHKLPSNNILKLFAILQVFLSIRMVYVVI
ncbi:MAG: sulfite exporter TauE/SafE family protein [Campylobacter sp.]|nr:sulfite exporter TauE/SafE family protein [Campylobacter sp.]